MKEPNKKYIDYDEYLKKEEKNLDAIYNDLLKDNEDKSAIKKFDRIVKSNIDYNGILPCSKSYQGESLLTLSKTWMIIILLKINKGRAQQDQFLTLVNSSLTHELNEYEEYRNFFDDQCELLFSEEEAIKGINLNPKLPKKLTRNISHEDLRNYYIYLLFKPQYFQKNDYEQMSKPQKRKYEKKEMERSKSKSNKSKNDNKKSINDEDIDLESEKDSENDEKGDRLDENDMISKNRTKQPKKKVSEKNKKTPSITKEKEKINKRKSEKDDKDYRTINDIINGKKKSENKEDKKKKKKSVDKSYIEDEDIDMEDISETKKEKEKKNKNKKKASINEKKKNKNVKKKYEEESEEEDEEEEEEEITDKKKKNKNKKAKEKEKGKEKENKSGKGKNKKEEKKKNKTSANKIFELLGIDSNLIEEEEEEDDEDKKEKKKKKERKTISVPQKKKKEKSNNKTKKESTNKREKEKKKEEDKNKGKKGKKKNQKKTKKSKSDIDDEDEFLSDDDIINSLTALNDSDTSDEYGINLDEDENKKMQKEIDAALEGNLDELDLEEILGDSKLEGISLSQLESKSKSSLDLGSFADES